MIILLESIYQDITRNLMNLGFNIKGCKIDYVNNNGSYKITKNTDYLHLSLEYSSEDNTMKIEYIGENVRSDNPDYEYEDYHIFKLPEELDDCIYYWNHSNY